MIDPGSPVRPGDKHRARALRLLETGDFASAVEHFRRIIRASPGSLEDRVLLAQALAQSGRPADAEQELRAVLVQAPDSADIHACLGQVIARTERRVQAVGHFERALTLEPGHWAASDLTALKALISQSVHSWHLPMLADSARNDAFQTAIEATIRPGDLVLDIGTGTGLLAMMAARAGAAQVVACEMLPDMAELARLVVAANGFADRISVVAKRSTDLVVGVDLPRRADVLLSETFDALLIGEGALDTFRHALAHLVAPGARVIPASGIIRGQLATIPRLKAMHPLGALNGFDLSAFTRHATEKQFYPVQLESEQWTPLSSVLDVIDFTFTTPIPARRDWTLTVPVTQTGVCQALVLWLDLQVDAVTHISSGPQGRLRHWNPVVFLFDDERQVLQGETIDIAARIGSDVFYFEMLNASPSPSGRGPG